MVGWGGGEVLHSATDRSSSPWLFRLQAVSLIRPGLLTRSRPNDMEEERIQAPIIIGIKLLWWFHKCHTQVHWSGFFYRLKMEKVAVVICGWWDYRLFLFFLPCLYFVNDLQWTHFCNMEKSIIKLFYIKTTHSFNQNNSFLTTWVRKCSTEYKWGKKNCW